MLFNQCKLQAQNRKDAVNEEGKEHCWESKLEEILGWVVVARYVNEPQIDQSCNNAADDASYESELPLSVHPVEAINVDQAVRSSKTHASNEEQNACVVECLVKPKSIVRSL